MADQPDQPHQSLYRRYRPARFAEVLGQDHVTLALRNSVRDGRPGQGYLFSGPRGTGKTSTARILAQALNCTKLDDGEPCGVCESCVQVRKGTSFDVHELDAASNNGVDAMRDLVARAALGTPGRWKVYIVDEVHMLSTAASNALLKTLEEPPGHVVFVLATTDPQKVLPTIKSRVQHFEFHLLPPETLGDLVRAVNADAGLGLNDHDLDEVVRRGSGSARDALSALDQVAALGGAEHEVQVADEVVEAFCERDTGRALVAVARGCSAGRDPRRLAEEILEHLRNAFLATMAPALVALPDSARARVDDQARRLGPAALVRAMERVGDALAEMREALDPRVSLEVALVRVTAPDADTTVAAVAERLDRLERRLAEGVPAPPPAGPVGGGTPFPTRDASAAAPVGGGPRGGAPVRSGDAPAGDPPARARSAGDPVPSGDAPSGGQPVAAAPAPGGGAPAPAPGPAPPPAGGRPERGALGAYRAANARPPAAAAPRPRQEPAPTVAPPTRSAPASPPSAPASPPPAATPAGGFPTRDMLTKAWGDTVLGVLSQRARARFKVGRFLRADDGVATFALPNAIHRDRCEECRPEVEQALRDHFGCPLRLELAVEAAEPAAAPPPDDLYPEYYSPEELEEAPPGFASPADRVKQAFPGAEEVEP